MRRGGSFAVAVAAAVIASTGCGGGSAPKPKPLSDTEFVAKANTICADVAKQYANADFDAKAGVLTDGADTLGKLVPPIPKQKTFNRFVQAVETEGNLWKQMVSGDNSEDRTDRFIENESRISSTAKALGTKKCTSVAGTQ